MTIMDENASDRLQLLVLERRDAQRNMARFYVLAIEPTLFGDVALLREWGRIGSTGCRRLDLHSGADKGLSLSDFGDKARSVAPVSDLKNICKSAEIRQDEE
jgi:predicted DNA-binding WGR domain protein